MKQKTVPEYPVMYKTSVVAGKPAQYRCNDFLFAYVCLGKGNMFAGGTSHPLEKGCGWIISRREPITFHTDTDMQIICIRISEEAVTDYLLHNFISCFPPSDERQDCIPIPNHLLLQSLISGITAGINNNFRANIPLTCIKIQECLNVLTCICPELHRWFYYRNRLQKTNLKAFMETHYRENLPLEQLAQTAGRSLSTFRRDFLREFGITPGRWLLSKRLEEAYRLITQKQLKPSVFLIELGFESFSHFSRSFKAHFGIQPSLLLRERTATNKITL